VSVRAVAIGCALLALAGVARADASVPWATGDLGAFVARLRAASSARDVRAVARLVDREFTTGEEQGRADSLDELRAAPALLDQLADLIDHGHCTVEPGHVQCDRFVAVPPDYRHGAIAIFGRVHARWRLLAFYPAAR
jgi:hypothetical protein